MIETKTAGAAGLISPATMPDKTADELIARLKDKDDQVRGAAWEHAGTWGAGAVKPLAARLADPDPETGRAAKRALWQVVRYAGRPGALTEQMTVTAELIGLLAASPPAVCREVFWMLAEIGGDEAAAPLAAYLSNPDLREDARLALQRLPAKSATTALHQALAAVPEEFKPNVAQALRARGERVEGYPSQRLVPNRPTQVKPAGS